MAVFKGLNLIMIDDSEDDAFITEFFLRQSKVPSNFFHIQKSQDACSELEKKVLAGCDPQTMVVLLDIMMPILNGFDVLDQIRSCSNLYKIPVIMLSSSETGTDIYRSLNGAADGYLTKPFASDAFWSALNNVCEKDGRYMPKLIEATA